MSTEEHDGTATPKVLVLGPGRFLADILTIGNAACGLAAIYFALLPYYFATGGFLLLAMLFDGLDGAAARRFGSWHSRGHQVDTAADVVTMATAPAVLAWSAVTRIAPDLLLLATVAAVAYAAFALTRLFNFVLKGYKMDKFSGLPSPGGMLMVLLLVFLFGPTPFLTSQPVLMAVLVIALSPLMILPVAYPKVRGRWALPTAIAGLAVGVPAILTYLSTLSYDSFYVKAGAVVALAYFLGYALYGPATALATRLRSTDSTG